MTKKENCGPQFLADRSFYCAGIFAFFHCYFMASLRDLVLFFLFSVRRRKGLAQSVHHFGFMFEQRVRVTI